MSGLYGYGNIVTNSGDYQLFPVIWVLGVAASGGGGVTFKGSTVQASLSFAPALIGAVNPYSVTAQDAANVTIASPGNTLIGALTGATFTADGGTITLASADAISALSGVSYNIQNGGTLNLNSIQGQSAISALSGSSVTFKAGGGTLVLRPGANVNVLSFKSISGFENSGSTIKIPGATHITSVSKNGDSTNITTDNGYTITVKGDFYDYAQKHNLYQSVQDGSLYISSSARNNTQTDGVLVCFLVGSMIRTIKGDIAVENIQIGDEIITFDWRNKKDITRPVVWVGKAHAIVRPDISDAEAGWPVRVMKNAIAENVPYKDMLITAEHCLFFKDSFVPVRMLVNGVSIFYDKSISSYDYYHVETEQHSVITADGMLTESYLDTGNRSSFRQEGKIATLRDAVKSWEDDAGAPLNVERAFVEPLYRALEWRETWVENSASGSHSSVAKPELTTDPDLHLVTETGAIIRPMRQNAQNYNFMLPSEIKSVRIVSRASRPSDVIGPFVDDRRSMGVAVGEINLLCAKKHYVITSHLQIEKPAGWLADMGWDGVAWTTGNAELPLGHYLSNGEMGILSLSVRAAGPYIVSATQAVQFASKSA